MSMKYGEPPKPSLLDLFYQKEITKANSLESEKAVNEGDYDDLKDLNKDGQNFNLTTELDQNGDF